MKSDKYMVENEIRANQYYQKLLDAFEREKFESLENEKPPDNIDWTELPQTILDDFEDLYGLIGESLEIRRSGSL